MEKTKLYVFLILFICSSCIESSYVSVEDLGNLTPETWAKAFEKDSTPDTIGTMNYFNENKFREEVTKIAKNILVEQYPDIVPEDIRYEKQSTLKIGDNKKRIVVFSLQNSRYCGLNAFCGCSFFLIVENKSTDVSTNFEYSSHFFYHCFQEFLYANNDNEIDLIVNECDNRGMLVAYICTKCIITLHNGIPKQLISFDEYEFNIGDEYQIGNILIQNIHIQKIDKELFVYTKTFTLLSLNPQTLRDEKYQENILLTVYYYDESQKKLVKKREMNIK